MIHYLTYDAIDKEKWDDCIKTSFNGNIYGYSWYLDVVADHWEGLVEDDYERVFPLTMGKKMGISYLFQPFFTQQLGIFSKNILTNEVVLAFIQAIPPRFKWVEILLNSFNRIDPEQYTVIPQVNHELDLIKSYENLQKGFSKNTKRNIKKGQTEGLTISKDIKPDEVIRLFRQHKGKDINHLKSRHYQKLKRLIYTCLYKGMAEMYGVFTPHNELCAGAAFVKNNRKAVFLFSGLSEEGKQMGAMPFLLDRFIQDHAESHLTLDFDGSNDENLARFYKSFGSKQTTYLKLFINCLPWYLNKAVCVIKGMKSNT